MTILASFWLGAGSSHVSADVARACQQVDGSTQITTAASAAHADGCRTVALPVSAEAVRWATWLPVRLEGADHILVSGTGGGEDFVPASARVFKAAETEAPSEPPLPIGKPLLGAVIRRAFGVEERVSAAAIQDAVQVTCRPGSKPAGLALDPGPRSLPEGARLRLHWRGEGDRGFSVGTVRAGEGFEAGVGFDQHGLAVAPLPADVEVRKSPNFVVLCPESGGVLTLADLRLVAVPPSTTPLRAAWMWQPGSWRDRPDAVLQDAKRLGIERLFVAVDMDEGGIRHEDAFARFVLRAGEAGISVVLVEGDPGMALEPGRASALKRLRAVAEYQRRTAPNGRLAGLQYDIEPYLLPAYSEDPGKVLRGWAETIELLGREAPADLDIVLPFWLRANPDAVASVLPAVAIAAKSVTVMAYRTAQSEIEIAAGPFLTWGSSVGMPIRVALEAGPVDNEVSLTYAPAGEGDLWALPGEDGTLLVRLDRPRRTTSARMFAPIHRTIMEPARVSFLGDERRMLAIAGASQPTLAAWPAFAGFAFHGLLR